jgi:hypothetical protein
MKNQPNYKPFIERNISELTPWQSETISLNPTKEERAEGE